MPLVTLNEGSLSDLYKTVLSIDTNGPDNLLCSINPGIIETVMSRVDIPLLEPRTSSPDDSAKILTQLLGSV